MNQRKKILVLTDAFQGLGGSERNITQLLFGIDKDKFEICIACFASGKLSEYMKEQGFSIVYLKKADIYTLAGLKTLSFLKKFVNERKISLIVTYHESSDFYGL